MEVATAVMGGAWGSAARADRADAALKEARRTATTEVCTTAPADRARRTAAPMARASAAVRGARRTVAPMARAGAAGSHFRAIKGRQARRKKKNNEHASSEQTIFCFVKKNTKMLGHQTNTNRMNQRVTHAKFGHHAKDQKAVGSIILATRITLWRCTRKFTRKFGEQCRSSLRA